MAGTVRVYHKKARRVELRHIRSEITRCVLRKGFAQLCEGTLATRRLTAICFFCIFADKSRERLHSLWMGDCAHAKRAPTQTPISTTL